MDTAIVEGRNTRRRTSELDGRDAPPEDDSIVGDPLQRYVIAESENTPLHLPTFLRNYEHDPATKVGPYVQDLCSSNEQFAELYAKTEGASFTSITTA